VYVYTGIHHNMQKQTKRQTRARRTEMLKSTKIRQHACIYTEPLHSVVKSKCTACLVAENENVENNAQSKLTTLIFVLLAILHSECGFIHALWRSSYYAAHPWGHSGSNCHWWGAYRLAIPGVIPCSHCWDFRLYSNCQQLFHTRHIYRRF